MNWIASISVGISFTNDAILQEALDVRVLTVANHATASMRWRSTTQMEITGGMDLLFLVHNSHCVPMPLTREWWEARFMFVDTTKEQVKKNIYSQGMKNSSRDTYSHCITCCFLFTPRSSWWYNKGHFGAGPLGEPVDSGGSARFDAWQLWCVLSGKA